MNRDAAYRRAVSIDRLMCLLHGHDELEGAPFDYREAVSWYLAEARLYVDALQVSRVRQVVDTLAEASNEIRAAALSASMLLGRTAEALGTATLIDRTTEAAAVLDGVAAALSGWPGFWSGADEDEVEPREEPPYPYGPEDEGTY